MEKYILLVITIFFSISCSGQKNEKNIVENPKGTWKVDKEFDENGNLIKYDSIYSWSSNNSELNNLSPTDRDSLIRTFESRFFKIFSGFEDEGFEDVFSQDSFFSKRFFNDDFFGSEFGNAFMDINKIRQQMIEIQKNFLEKYQSEFVNPEDEN